MDCPCTIIIDKNIDAVQARLNRVIQQVGTWFLKNSLIVNTDKTKAILFHLNKTCNYLCLRLFLKMMKPVTHLKLSS